MNQTLCPEDYSFGPQTSPLCRDGLDLTLVFEESILSLVPASLMITASVARLTVLVKRRLVIPGKSFYDTKAVRTTSARPCSPLTICISCTYRSLYFYVLYSFYCGLSTLRYEHQHPSQLQAYSLSNHLPSWFSQGSSMIVPSVQALCSIFIIYSHWAWMLFALEPSLRFSSIP
jgi:hypothetical protein